jgi:peptidoglycan/LPS O-acetylase OafA/YrhL
MNPLTQDVGPRMHQDRAFDDCRHMPHRAVNERETYLDGMRGYASLVVLLGHIIIALLPSVVTLLPNDVHSTFDLAIGQSPLGFAWNGNAAVCLFFVLSGYVLSKLAQRSALSVAAQLGRRYARLALPMLITVLIPLALMRAGLMNNYAAAQVTHSGWLSLWYQFDPSGPAAIWEMLYGAFSKGQSAYNSNLWTMRLELFGSFYVFVINAMSTSRYIRLVCYLFFIATTPFDYYPLFAVGALLHDFRQPIATCFGLGAFPPLFATMSFVVGIYFCGIPATDTYRSLTWFGWLPLLAAGGENARYWHEIGACLVMIGLLNSRHLQVFFSNGFGRWLGKISFTLYLIQLPIICSLTAWLVLRLQGQSYGLLVTIAGGTSIIAVLGIATSLTKFADAIPTALSQRVGREIDRLGHLTNAALLARREGRHSGVPSNVNKPNDSKLPANEEKLSPQPNGEQPL